MPEITLYLKPDPHDPNTALVFVSGMLGEKPIEFLLDTGAARTWLPSGPHTAGLERIGEERSSGLFAEEQAETARVPLLQVGESGRENFPVVVGDPEHMPLGGLLGMDYLIDHRCRFQFSRDRLILDGDPPALDPARLLPVAIDDRNHIYLDAAWGDDRARAVWDTGAGITVVGKGLVQRRPDLFQKLGSTTGTDGTGVQQETPLYRMEGPSFGPWGFRSCAAAAVDLDAVNRRIETPMDLILGFNLIREADWYFDFPGRRWAITRGPERS